ncbi:MAG: hypothetical protein KDD50_10620 [Bdellovibrionales bacterium]|nr:hypothetical protein [Bdellovibrionales bacterium]
MSSVDNSNRNDDAVRRSREEYQTKESNLRKTQNKEIRRISEQHKKEIDDLKKQHTDQMKALSDRLRDEIAIRENKHQDEMDSLRQLNRQKLTQTIRDSDQKIQNYRESVENNSDRKIQAYETRLDKLSRDYEEKVRLQKQMNEQQLNDLRKKQEEAITSDRETLTKAHSTKVNTLKESRDREVMELQDKLQETRLVTNARLKAQQIQQFSDKKRLTDNFISQMNRERLARQDSEMELRDGFDRSIDQIKKKDDLARKEERLAYVDGLNNLREEVFDRMGERSQSLEASLANEKSMRNREKVKLLKNADIRVKNVRENMQKNIDHYADVNKKMRENLLDQNAEDINKVRKETSDAIQFSNRFHRNRAQMIDEKNRNAFSQLKQDFAAHKENQEKLDDISRQRLQNEYNRNISRINEGYQQSITSLRNSNDEEKVQIREHLASEHNDSVNNLMKRVADNDIKHAQKLSQTIEKYESEIDKMKAESTINKKRAEFRAKKTIDNLQKDHQVQLDALRLQYEQKLAEVKDHQRQETEQMNKRHKEQVDNLLTVIRKA